MSNQKDRQQDVHNPLEPVPRYEFINMREDIARLRQESIDAKVADELRVANLDKKIDDGIKDINARLEDKYMTSKQVNDQFKIELSDYKFIKVILGVVAMGVLSLIFAVIQQYLINAGSN